MQSFKKSNNQLAQSNISGSSSKYYQRPEAMNGSNGSLMSPNTPMNKDFHRITGIDLDEMKKLR